VVQEAADLIPGEDGGATLEAFGRGEEDGVNLCKGLRGRERMALRA